MNDGGIVRAHRSGLAGLLLGLAGFRHSGASLVPEGIVVHSRNSVTLAFGDIAEEPRSGRTLGVPSLRVRRRDGTSLRVVGLKAAEAAEFAERAGAAWRDHHSRTVAGEAREIRELGRAVDRLRAPRRYPAACLLEPYLRRCRSLLARLPDPLPETLVSPELRGELDRIRRFARSPGDLRRAAVRRFVEDELERVSRFLDGAGSRPLTPEQRRAVVEDEDATLVLAGAGSGKTTVLVAKTAYLVERGIRRPDEILLVALNKGIAGEMAERVAERVGSPVAAKTFHALGYGIVREVEGGGPALAPHAEDEVRFRALIGDLLLEEVAGTPGLDDLLRRWFQELARPYRSLWDFETMNEYYRHVEAHDLRTLQGERVRSFEELEIANWLFLNGIAYEYEPVYGREPPGSGRRAYRPDFRLTESGVYIEHFGVRRETGPDGRERLTTAPFVDRDAYLEDMEWKRGVHRKHGTTLVETSSQERVEGRLTTALAEKIAPHATPRPIPPARMFEALSRLGQIDGFTQTLATFLRLFKGASTTVEACRKKGRATRDADRNLAFLEIFEAVLDAYRRRLDGRIDFEDMILRATDHVRSGRYRSPYRHLLVDEFQDVSESRAKLLLALGRQHGDARVFAVGDDWQSIYRFAGSEIRLMRHFGEEFGGAFDGETGVHATVALARTFRNVDRIALPARDFVLRNPAQIPKDVVPAGKSPSPAIGIAYHEPAGSGKALEDALKRVGGDAGAASGRQSVLLLGRYRAACPKNLRDLRARHPGLDLRFRTAHGAKGLEADHVVILGAVSGRMGFPSEIVDDPLLDMVLPEAEEFGHAEERRLFYVALTRARRSVTILADRDRPSAFARELERNREDVAILSGDSGGPGIAARGCDECGGRMLARTSGAGFAYFACEHRPLCDGYLPACPSCGTDLPAVDGTDPATMKCGCGAEHPACPSCGSGWLVPRKGRHGAFLGCVRYPDCRGKVPVGAGGSAAAGPAAGRRARRVRRRGER